LIARTLEEKSMKYRREREQRPREANLSISPFRHPGGARTMG
jgi:hypothetical protein